MADQSEHGHSHGDDIDLARAEAIEEEDAHFNEVLHGFMTYEMDMLEVLGRRERNVKRVPELVQMLPGGKDGLEQKYNDLRTAVRKNQNFFNEVVENCKGRAKLARLPSLSTQIRNLTKVRSTLHQCAREWSTEGQEERDKCFAPLLKWLQEYVEAGTEGNKRVLVPGAGLGRLLAEVVGLGYSCEGNEFSYQMLVTSEYILNVMQSSDPSRQLQIHPWIHNPSNVVKNEDACRTVSIPDIAATEILYRNPNNKAEMSMCAGEFLLVYGKDVEKWDSVVTCFFIDTAPNVLEYLKVIHRCLKPGGVWINGGPLLWHWQNSGPRSASEGASEGQDERYETSIELSWEEVKAVAERVGLEFRDELRQVIGYNTNASSMSQSVYHIVQSVAVKK